MLTLHIQDMYILDRLAQYTSNVEEQEQIALYAMRLGLEAMALMRGEIDKQSLQQVGQSILAQVQETVVSVLNEHRQTLLDQFSMDIPDSTMQKLSSRLDLSYSSIRDEVTKLGERRNNQRRSTQGGGIFEDDLGAVLQDLVQGANDNFERTGNTVGKKDKSKVGDFVITLGENCHAPGEKIVVEAKRDGSYTLTHVLSECKIARANRNAQVCVFVWDKESCGGKHPPLKRYENDIVVLWDADDANTNICVEAAFWLAKSLVIPQNGTNTTTQVHFDLLQNAFEQVVQQVEALEKVKKSGETIIKQGQLIFNGCNDILAILEANIESMPTQVNALSESN